MEIFREGNEPINERKIIDSIRLLAIDMINEAKSGHPGIALDLAPTIYTVYANHLRFDPENPNFYNRDRFVLSCGHASSVLYSTLYMAGFDLTLDDLKNFRQIDSKTPGHPELGVTPGVDISTGPLGEGFASAVGMAMAGKHTNALLETKDDVIDYNVYVVCSDGDLMEGVSYEAASLAGNLQLDNLIVLYDSNRVTLDGELKLSSNNNIRTIYEGMGWNTQEVSNGEDTNAISLAIDEAKKSNKPTLIEIKTTIGKYSKLEGTNLCHGKPLDTEDITAIKEKLGIRDIPFAVASDALEDFRYIIGSRNVNLIEDFSDKFEKLSSSDKQFIESLFNKNKDIPLGEFDLDPAVQDEIRTVGGKVLNAYSSSKLLFGGSADLFSSCKNYIEDGGVFSKDNYQGKNIYFGVREHAMGSILNGLSLCGYKAYGSTFLSFSDYLKPAIRMAALQNLGVFYIFTHDSISVGEDGPTHEPVEQLNNLRTTINLKTYRPCDGNEVIGSFKDIMENDDCPSALVLSKNSVKPLEETSVNSVRLGGYVVRSEQRSFDGILISSGEEVSTAVEIAERLAVKGFDLRVVSMPSLGIFLEQTPEYIDEILPVEKKKIVIEKAPGVIWNKLIFNDKYIISQEEYGVSGKRDDVLKKFGFDIDTLEEKIENLIK